MFDFDGCGPLCDLDIWNSGDRDHYSNNSFSGYAFYEQEKKDAVQEICRQAKMGNYNFSLEVDSNLTQSDIEEIQREAARQLGL